MLLFATLQITVMNCFDDKKPSQPMQQKANEQPILIKKPVPKKPEKMAKNRVICLHDGLAPGHKKMEDSIE
ncbi:hypothetical protein DdX_09523 [Ditylenchus destructor]|uniref:Uncharacterized protein n=1 Tax=Ditylenchus destructor TaxID=166010 RepID=A0AAD4N0L8_9BILA|nr:hypothetical protein DdX_09523 [Ditylenchus destructor]